MELLAIDFVGGVQTVASTATTREAADLMARGGVGCLVVVDEDGRAVGMLTDRDLAVRAIAAGLGADAEIEDVCTRDLVTVPDTASLEQVAHKMRAHAVRRVPVVDGEGRPVALISLDDLLGLLGMRLSGLTGAIDAELRRERRADEEPEVETLAERLLHRLQLGRWKMNAALLDELDELRDQVRAKLD